jgi:retron-type reverse transcriptase
MTKASGSLQELRRRIYRKAKSDKTHRFWGLFVHIAKRETLEEAYRIAKRNGGAPGIDDLSFEDIEASAPGVFLAEIQADLRTGRYEPKPNRRVEIPKGNGKVRILQVPCIRDRVVQGALKLILEAVFEADFCPNSYGFGPKRSRIARWRKSDAACCAACRRWLTWICRATWISHSNAPWFMKCVRRSPADR